MSSCNTTNSIFANTINPLFVIHKLNGSLKCLYTIPILLMCFIGLIENIFAFQSFLSSFLNGKTGRRHLIYFLILSLNGLCISILLPIGIFCSFLKEFRMHINMCDIFILLSLIINTFSLWISSVLSIDAALFNIYVGTMLALSPLYAVKISIFLVLFVIGSYVSWIINEPFSINIISVICSLFHLLIPCLIHTIASILGVKESIRRRMNLLKDKTTYIKQFLEHQEYLRSLILVFICMIPHLFIIILICYNSWRYSDKEILSSEVQILLITFMFPPQMLTFSIHISPRKTYMKEYRNLSPLGKLINKIYPQKKVKKKSKHVAKEVSPEKY